MKIYQVLTLLIPVCCFISCTGPRNIYSASPFVSPVRMDKGNTAVEANYFTHTRQTNRDTIPGIHDNCIGLNISHMFTERTLVFFYIDTKKEGGSWRKIHSQIKDKSVGGLTQHFFCRFKIVSSLMNCRTAIFPAFVKWGALIA